MLGQYQTFALSTAGRVKALTRPRSVVEIDFSKLKDGDKLIAGEKTYVFKVARISTHRRVRG